MRRSALALMMLLACKKDGAEADRLSDIVELHAEGDYVCAVDSKRRVYCWGSADPDDGADGRHEPSVDVPRPRHIEGADGVSELLLVDPSRAIAHMPDGRLLAWTKEDFRLRKTDAKGDDPPLWPGVDPVLFDGFHAHPTGLTIEGRLLWLETPCQYSEGELRCADPYPEPGLPYWGDGQRASVPGMVAAATVGSRFDDDPRPAHCMLFDDGRVDCVREGRTWTIDVGGGVRTMVDGGNTLGLVLEDGRVAITDWNAVPHLESRIGPVRDLDVHRSRACVITEELEVRCWLGPGHPDDGDPHDPEIDTTIPGLDHPTRVQVLGAGGCVLEADGRVKCWGPNDHGQCGVGYVSKRVDVPTHVVAPG